MAKGEESTLLKVLENPVSANKPQYLMADYFGESDVYIDNAKTPSTTPVFTTLPAGQHVIKIGRTLWNVTVYPEIINSFVVSD
jgi:hypothetical protein